MTSLSGRARDAAIVGLLGLSLAAWYGNRAWLSIACWVAGALLMWSGDLSRNIWWYAATLPFQLPQSALLARIAAADLFVLPLLGREALLVVAGGFRLPRTTIALPIAALMFVFAVATFVGYFQMGQVSWWALLNKDAGLLLLVGSTLVVARTVRTLDDARRLARWFIGGVGVANATSLVAAAAAFAGYHNSLYMIDNGRLYGWMLNPSVNGGLLCTAGMLELGLLMQPGAPGERRGWRWANVWLIALGLGLTFSRSTWLSVAAASAALITAGIVHRARTGDWRLSHVGAAAVWMALPMLVLGGIVQARGGMDLAEPAEIAADLQARLVDQCLDNPTLEICKVVDLQSARPRTKAQSSKPDAFDTPLTNVRGLHDRLAIASEALNAYRRDATSLVFGIGLGTFYATSAPTFGVPLIIHNTFIWFLVELGPIGLVVLLWFWGRTIVNLWTAANARNGGEYLAYGLTAALAGLAIFCLLNEGFYQRQLWLVVALADRLYCLGADERVTVSTGAQMAPA